MYSNSSSFLYSSVILYNLSLFLYILYNFYNLSLEELRASKENMTRVSPRPLITRLTKTTLPKLDINDPESLAAFASPDSFDSRELDDELLLSIGEEESFDDDEEDEEEEGERLEEEMFEIDNEKLAKHKR